MRTKWLRALGAAALTVMTACWSAAQQPPAPTVDAKQIQLFESAGYPSGSLPPAVGPAPLRPTAAELRQARAQYVSQMQIARIEAAQWMGYHLSRPNVPAVPMMTSRYAPRRTVVVPVYVYPGLR